MAPPFSSLRRDRLLFSVVSFTASSLRIVYPLLPCRTQFARTPTCHSTCSEVSTEGARPGGPCHMRAVIRCGRLWSPGQWDWPSPPPMKDIDGRNPKNPTESMEEHRAGKDCVRQCKHRGAQYH